MTDPTYHTAVRLLKADFKTGKLFWLPRSPDLFKNKKRCASWNSRFAGKEALTAKNPHGHRSGTLLGRSCWAHRVIWLLAHKEWPKNQIDHINGDASDNRLVNLRDVTASENLRNQRRSRNNTSGVLGVSWNKTEQKWRVQIMADGRNKTVGQFVEIEDAIAVRKAAEKLYGFHENHGRVK